MSERTVSVRLLAQIAGYISPMQAAVQTTKDLRSELTRAAQAGNLDAVASQASRAGLALSGGFLLATGAAARFEKAMSEVDAVVEHSGDQMAQLSQAAIQAGKDTVFSASEAARAEAELGKAGISAADILGGALTGSLSLAAAGSLELEEAAEVAAKAMNVFGLGGRDVGHIADVLAAAANKSATDVHELGFALKMGGLAAKNSGVSLEETIGTFAAFADNALAGSDAGTSFKTMLQMLASPSDVARKRMESLGISAYDAQGNFVGIAKLAGILQERLGDLTMEQRDEALATIFGSDAMRAATVLMNEGERGIREYTQAVDDQGAAQETAAKKTDNLMGDIERLTGALESLFIESASGSNSGLRILVQGLTGLVDVVTSLPGPVLTAGTVLVGLTGVGLLAFSAFIKTRGAIRDMVEELRDAGPASGRLATGLEFTTRWATRATFAFAALTAAGTILRAFTGEAEVDINSLNESLQRLGATGEVTGELARMFGADLSQVGEDMAITASGVGDFGRGVEDALPIVRSFNEAVGQGWNKAADHIKTIDSALAEMVRSGHADQAAAVFKRLWEEAQKQGVELEELQAMFPSYIDAAGEAAKSTGRQADAAKAATAANRQLAGAFGEAASEAGGLVKTFDKLHGGMIDWKKAEGQVEQALDDLREGFAENGKTLDQTTDKGRANVANLIAVAEATRDAMQAKMDETHSVKDAQKVYDTYYDQLYDIARAAGYTKDQAKKLADQWLQMPSTVTTTVDVKIKVNLSAAQAQLRRIQDQLSGRSERWGGVTIRAETGSLREAGIYSAGASPLYAFAEPETKGEAFVPKSGNYGRSMSILSTAAGWYGADVVPRQQGWYAGQHMTAMGTSAGGAMAGPMVVENHIEIGGEVVRVVRTEISENNRQIRRTVVGRRGR